MISDKLIAFRRFAIKKKNGLVIRYTKFKLRLRGNTRPTSYPMITGDSFRALTHLIHDSTRSFPAGTVARGDIVFVGQGQALQFLQEMHPEILVPYVLIIHNGDATIDKRHVALMDEKIIHCYAQNVSISHEKLTPLPVALSNFCNFEHTHSVYRTPTQAITEKDYLRKNKIFYRFLDDTCPSVRVPLRHFCEKHPLAETVHERLSQSAHINLMRTYKFVISPRGNAIDTHRPFEAFQLGVIPITLPSVTVQSLYAAGLPYWIINDWKDLQNVTEDDLARKYKELMQYAKFDAMHMDYWIAKIKRSQESAQQ